MTSTFNDEELKSGFEIDNLKGYHHCDNLSHDHPHHQHSVTFRVPLIGGIPSILTSFRIISKNVKKYVVNLVCSGGHLTT